ncbi:hypothetical protein WB403_46675 [Streptomyces brasiliscabiei]|uniref:Uncharacterized protein n=1 Tax=Streptomyces brasiliscabiei TaxID=2736302 RepID=A0ABU8GUF3_9ACTN
MGVVRGGVWRSGLLYVGLLYGGALGVGARGRRVLRSRALRVADRCGGVLGVGARGRRVLRCGALRCGLRRLGSLADALWLRVVPGALAYDGTDRAGPLSLRDTGLADRALDGRTLGRLHDADADADVTGSRIRPGVVTLAALAPGRTLGAGLRSYHGRALGHLWCVQLKIMGIRFITGSGSHGHTRVRRPRRRARARSRTSGRGSVLDLMLQRDSGNPHGGAALDVPVVDARRRHGGNRRPGRRNRARSHGGRARRAGGRSDRRRRRRRRHRRHWRTGNRRQGIRTRTRTRTRSRVDTRTRTRTRFRTGPCR